MFTRVETECAILERHLHVLDAVASHEPVGLITLTNRLAHPRHKIEYSLRVLEAEDLVAPTPDGATTTAHATRGRAELNRRLAAITHTIAQLGVDRSTDSSVPSHPVATDS